MIDQMGCQGEGEFEIPPPSPGLDKSGHDTAICQDGHVGRGAGLREASVRVLAVYSRPDDH